MKKFTYIITSFMLAITISCSDEFLEVDPKATQIESNYYKNADQAFNGLVAAYDPIGWEGEAAGGGYANFACMVAGSDEAYSGGGSSSDLWWLQVMNNYNLLDPANGPQMGFWQKGFTGVYRSNVIISKLADNIPGLSESERARYIAEAKVLRAYF